VPLLALRSNAVLGTAQPKESDMGTLISSIGGVIVGHVLISFAIECGGFKDYRFWGGFLGFAMAIIGLAISA